MKAQTFGDLRSAVHAGAQDPTHLTNALETLRAYNSADPERLEVLVEYASQHLGGTRALWRLLARPDERLRLADVLLAMRDERNRYVLHILLETIGFAAIDADEATLLMHLELPEAWILDWQIETSCALIQELFDPDDADLARHVEVFVEQRDAILAGIDTRELEGVGGYFFFRSDKHGMSGYVLGHDEDGERIRPIPKGAAREDARRHVLEAMSIATHAVYREEGRTVTTFMIRVAVHLMNATYFARVANGQLGRLPEHPETSLARSFALFVLERLSR
ncbi:MAG: hypothetical protein AAGI01_15285 [Myxococcota bacterium]